MASKGSRGRWYHVDAAIEGRVVWSTAARTERVAHARAARYLTRAWPQGQALAGVVLHALRLLISSCDYPAAAGYGVRGWHTDHS